MDKHEALEALEKAHKLRKHADRIEREAHEILDKREERHEDEHEVKASAAHDHIGVKHAHLAALHRALSDYHDNKAAESHGEKAHMHAGFSAGHMSAAEAHYAKTDKALAGHSLKSVNELHKRTEANIGKKFGDALFHHESFNARGARSAIKKLAH